MIGAYSKLSEDQDKRRVYAKAKAIEVHKRLKETNGNHQGFQGQQPQQPVQIVQPGTNVIKGGINGGGQGNLGGNKKKLDPERVAAQ